MTRLTKTEREALKRLDEEPIRSPVLPAIEQVVHPTPESRLNYIRFNTAASALFQDTRPIIFRGNDWRL